MFWSYLTWNIVLWNVNTVNRSHHLLSRLIRNSLSRHRIITPLSIVNNVIVQPSTSALCQSTRQWPYVDLIWSVLVPCCCWWWWWWGWPKWTPAVLRQRGVARARTTRVVALSSAKPTHYILKTFCMARSRASVTMPAFNSATAVQTTSATVRVSRYVFMPMSRIPYYR